MPYYRHHYTGALAHVKAGDSDDYADDPAWVDTGEEPARHRPTSTKAKHEAKPEPTPEPQGDDTPDAA